ncbi:hypothetical protein ACVBIL_12435 [Shewanella sp. 125m-7]
MKNIKVRTQCDSFLYLAHDSLVVASSSEKIGSMLRFEVAGNYYILGLKGELSHCRKNITSSAEHLASHL